VPPDLATDLLQWRDIAIDLSSEALVFPSERGMFMSRDNFLRRNIHDKTGEDWPRLGELSGVAQNAG
jgi:hypothetical protein